MVAEHVHVCNRRPDPCDPCDPIGDLTPVTPCVPQALECFRVARKVLEEAGELER
jgi:hypothetical protein